MLAPLFRRLRVLDHAHEVLLVVDVALTVDVADVRLGRALRDVELLLDVGGVMAFGQEEQDLGLATRQEERVRHGLAFAAETAAAARRFARFREARFGNRRGCGLGCLPFARDRRGGWRCGRVRYEVVSVRGSGRLRNRRVFGTVRGSGRLCARRAFAVFARGAVRSGVAG